MGPERLARAKEFFFDALQRRPEERGEFLTAACGDDLKLRQEVQELLDWHEGRDDLLDRPAAEALGLVSSPPDDSARLEPPAELSAGDRLKKRYVIEKVLARGGFAVVYLARDEFRGGKQVVVKALNNRPATGDLQMLRSELSALGEISDPAIIDILDTGDLPTGGLFLVMPYVGGVTLREALKKSPFSTARALAIVRRTAQAMIAAHAKGVWHLDLKPENILLSHPDSVDERVTIIDLGISSVRGIGTGRAWVAGSTDYMAPEQVLGRPGAQSDVYALGVVLYELLTAECPPADGSVDARLSELRRDLPASLRALVATALAREPDRRFHAMAQFAVALTKESAISQKRLPRWVVAVSGASIVVAGFGLLSLSVLTERPAAPLGMPIPLTTEAGLEQQPSLSPDGKRLFYAGTASGANSHIYLKALDSPVPIRLTPETSRDVRPVCSPDGKWLAFQRLFATGDEAIVVMSAAGGPERMLWRGGSIEGIAWTPDGNGLIVSHSQGGTTLPRLRLFRLGSDTWLDLTHPPEGSRGDSWPALSPDGRALVFVRRQSGASADLFRVELDRKLRPSSEPRRLTNQSLRMTTPQWAPDGRNVLYVAGPLGYQSVWRVPADGNSQPQIVREAGGRIESISIARAGKKLAYAIDLSDSNIWRAELSGPGGSVREWKQVTATTYDDEECRISPNGKLIVLTSGRTGQQQVWTAASDGSNPRQLTHFAGAEVLAAYWLPDSENLIVAVGSSTLGDRSFLMSATGGEMKLVLDAYAVNVSRDGRSIYFRSNRSGRDEVWRVRIGGSEWVQVTHSGGSFVRESLDGKSLFFSNRDEREGVWKQPIGGGQAIRLTEGLARRSSFAVGRTGLYYIGRQDGKQTTVLRFYRFKDGKTTDLHNLEKRPFWGFDVSAGERMIVFSQFDVSNSDIMLIDNVH